MRTGAELKLGLIANSENNINDFIAKKVKFKIFGAGMVTDDEFPFLDIPCFRTRYDIFLGLVTTGTEYSRQVTSPQFIPSPPFSPYHYLTLHQWSMTESLLSQLTGFQNPWFDFKDESLAFLQSMAQIRGEFRRER